jgi:hypothetical protein
MMTRCLVVALVGIAVPIIASTVDAQAVSSVSLDVSVGAGKGWSGGEYVGNRSGLAVDALLGFRLRSIGREGLMVGFSGGIQRTGESSTVCRPALDGSCVPSFPDFYTLSALAGWESGRGILRVMLGPAFVQASGEGHALGVQGRLDLAAPFTSHIGVVASIRPTVVPSYRGDTLKLLAFGIGLRLR